MAIIPSDFISKLGDVLLQVATDEAMMLLGVPDEIMRLHRRLGMIRDLLVDAQRRRIHDQAINRWLGELKDLMYDADDIIDECKIVEQRKADEQRNIAAAAAGSSSSSCFPSAGQLVSYVLEFLVRCCMPPFSRIGFRHRIGKKIKSLNASLDEIIKEKNDFGLALIPHIDDQRRRPSGRRTSPLVEPELVGTKIEEDTSTLVKLLVEEPSEVVGTKIEDHRHEMPTILGICGMGGIGKTTLAQKIVQDERVQTHFYIVKPMWVCVTQDVDEVKILREIINRAGGDPGNAQDRADLEPELCKVISQKKIFLVLDDVWDASVWHGLLRKPMQSCGSGSRILITTRSTTVAREMGAAHVHKVEKLSDEDGWLLLSNLVFGKDSGNDNRKKLLDIGMQIVSLCDGLPLAVNAIAGVLKGKAMLHSEWEKVLRNPVWSTTDFPQGVRGALYLSYEDLPSYIKPCFLYFALFPKDRLLDQIEIQAFWCSEGFVEPLGNLTMEETAEEYWKELFERNLLQQDPEYFDLEACKVHDLMRELTQHLANDESFCGDAHGFGEERSSSTSLVKLRRLMLYNCGEGNFIPNTIRRQTCLRALILDGIQKLQFDDLKALKCLRILDLRDSPLEELPNSVADLIHLRYLNLSNTKLRNLPQCIGYLWNLRFLSLRSCEYLHCLPSSIVMLHNLEVLQVDGTPLDCIPLGMTRLHQLRELLGFVLPEVEEGRDHNAFRQRGGGSSTLEDLGSLSQLTRLSIDALERVPSKGEARAAALMARHRLRELGLFCCIPCSTFEMQEEETLCTHHPEEMMKRIEEVFEELSPPPSLEMLQFRGYFGRELPRWLMVMEPLLFPTLRRLVLWDCNHFEKLPALGQLPQLDYLQISGASGITSIGPELFFGSSNGDGSQSSSFLMLSNLYLDAMPNWKEWRWFGDQEGDQELLLLPPPSIDIVVLPRLRYLTIDKCPSLRSLPSDLINHAAALEYVYIRGAHSLREIKNLLHVKKLVLVNNPMLEEVSNLPNLKRLLLEGDWSNLKTVVHMDALQQLELLDRRIEFLPEWLLESRQHFGALQKLDIEGSIGLLSRCLPDGGSEWPKIRDIPQVKAKTYDGLTYFSYAKIPFAFDTNLKQ